MTKRAKALAIPDRDEFFITVNRIAELQRFEALLKAKRDMVLLRVQAKFGEKLKPIQDAIKGMISLADAYGKEHRSELLPKDKKSASLHSAVYGWRDGNPAVKTLRRGQDEQEIIIALKARGLGRYVRMIEEIAKAKILSDVGTHTVDDENVQCLLTDKNEPVPLTAVGLRIAQTEEFFVTPRVETGETVKA
jgi:phage host-nuclease inhibitor protein Gam